MFLFVALVSRNSVHSNVSRVHGLVPHINASLLRLPISTRSSVHSVGERV
jgi:hypothetical protein